MGVGCGYVLVLMSLDRSQGRLKWRQAGMQADRHEERKLASEQGTLRDQYGEREEDLDGCSMASPPA